MPLDPGQKLAYSVEEAVEAWPWGKTKLYELMASGELPWRKRFGRRYIMREDLEALIKKRASAASSPGQPEETTSQRRRPAIRCGVYLLLSAGRTVYVGRSTELVTRIATHRRSGREFDEVRIIPCDRQTSVWLERELIRVLRPSQNLLRYQRSAALAARALDQVLRAC